MERGGRAFLFQRGLEGPAFSLGSSWGGSLVSKGKIGAGRKGLWVMAVVQFLFASHGAVCSDETLLGEGYLCSDSRKEGIRR